MNAAKKLAAIALLVASLCPIASAETPQYQLIVKYKPQITGATHQGLNYYAKCPEPSSLMDLLRIRYSIPERVVETVWCGKEIIFDANPASHEL